MPALYPHIEPYQTGFLKVDPLHTLYYEQCGNPDGKPVVFLHGGPGGGTTPAMRRFFDPDAYRIVLFDQRGCGKSAPHAELEGNTTWDLVADIERLRDALGIDTWQVFGGSWGSALALAYAERHPERVTELVLRGIFTLRRAELEWFYQHGASEIFPEAFAEYVADIPAEERGDLMTAYYRRLTDDNPDVRMAFARRWSVWEASTSNLIVNEGQVAQFSRDDFALAFARIECHYFVNGGFFDRDDQLIAEAGRIRHIPGVIVQGRYDLVCPMRTAYDLSKAWPEARLVVVPTAGHAAFEEGIASELVAATDAFRS